MITHLRYAHEGTFRILNFHISHSRLLLRHTYQCAGHPVNVDLIFSDVFYMEMPEKLDGIFIENGDKEDIDYIIGRYNDKHNIDYIGTKIQVFKVISEERKFYVVAKSIEIDTNFLNPATSGFTAYIPRGNKNSHHA